MDKIIFATGNAHKMVEIRMILEDLGVEILSQAEAGIHADVVEDGSTFEENALIKATRIREAAAARPEYKNAVVLADDSGLEIDYLNKEPGIYSARYMEKILPMILRTRRFWTGWRACRMKSGRPVLCAPSRRRFRTELRKW